MFNYINYKKTNKMARGNLSERFNRTLIELGKGTLCVTIPVEFLEELGWKKGEEVKVSMHAINKTVTFTEIPDSSSN